MFLKELSSASLMNKLWMLLVLGLALVALRRSSAPRQWPPTDPPPAPAAPPSPAPAARLRDIEERLLRLEDQHQALATNLTDANVAFRRLISQMDELNRRVAVLVDEPAPAEGRQERRAGRGAFLNGNGSE